MKSIFFYFFIFCSISSNAQSNLQFQKVKLISSLSDTVPAGRVWKVESAIYSGEISVSCLTNQCGGNNCADNRVAKIVLNGNEVNLRKSSAGWCSAGGTMLWEMHFPFWLPAGTAIRAGQDVLYLSIIEFSVE